MNRYYNPVRTVEGDGCLSRLPEVLAEMALPEKRAGRGLRNGKFGTAIW